MILSAGGFLSVIMDGFDCDSLHGGKFNSNLPSEMSAGFCTITQSIPFGVKLIIAVVFGFGCVICEKIAK